MIINMTSGGVMPDRIIDAQTITPGTKNQVFEEGTYLRETLTILGDADLMAKNIREGIDIFGVIGTVVEGVGGIAYGKVTLSSDQTAITVAHDLGVVPKWVCIVIDSIFNNSAGGGRSTQANINGQPIMLTDVNSGYFFTESRPNTVTESQIIFNTRPSGYPYKGGKNYYWFAVA